MIDRTTIQALLDAGIQFYTESVSLKGGGLTTTKLDRSPDAVLAQVEHHRQLVRSGNWLLDDDGVLASISTKAGWRR